MINTKEIVSMFSIFLNFSKIPNRGFTGNVLEAARLSCCSRFQCSRRITRMLRTPWAEFTGRGIGGVTVRARYTFCRVVGGLTLVLNARQCASVLGVCIVASSKAVETSCGMGELIRTGSGVPRTPTCDKPSHNLLDT